MSLNEFHFAMAHNACFANSIFLFGPVAKFLCAAWLGAPRAGPALWNYPTTLYSRRINTVRQKGSAWRVLPTFAWNTLYSEILPAKSGARRRQPATHCPPSQAVHWNLAMAPKDWYIPPKTLQWHKWQISNRRTS